MSKLFVFVLLPIGKSEKNGCSYENSFIPFPYIQEHWTRIHSLSLLALLSFGGPRIFSEPKTWVGITRCFTAHQAGVQAQCSYQDSAQSKAESIPNVNALFRKIIKFALVKCHGLYTSQLASKSRKGLDNSSNRLRLPKVVRTNPTI